MAFSETEAEVASRELETFADPFGTGATGASMTGLDHTDAGRSRKWAKPYGSPSMFRVSSFHLPCRSLMSPDSAAASFAQGPRRVRNSALPLTVSSSWGSP